MDEVDILVIGAGIIGLAVAEELSSSEYSVIVLERNKTFGQETSSRNSEVLHAGMHYPCGTLKAKTCVEGNRLLYEICEKNKIPYKKIGKLIVATNKEELLSLDALFLQGRDNGVARLQIIGRQELNKLEPNISGLAALYSPETGIVDSHCLMEYFLDSAKDKGAMVAYNSEATAIEKVSAGYKVSVQNSSEVCVLKTKFLINCAGLDSDSIAAMAGIDIKRFGYELHYCKGQYFRVNSRKSGLIKRLIYPVPEAKSGGLGIHATLDLGGSLRLGPDDEYLKGRDKDYSVNDSKRHDFYVSARRLLPFLEEEDLSSDTSGIRPKLQGPEEDFRDFIIDEESDKGFPGLINLIGIESPGLTSSPAIARLVKNLIGGGG